VVQPATSSPVSGVTAATLGWLMAPTVVKAPPRNTLLPSEAAASA
jgi:hypothetical protein